MYPQSLQWAIPEKKQQVGGEGGLRSYFFENPTTPLTPGSSRQNKAPPLKIPQIFVLDGNSTFFLSHPSWDFTFN